MYILFQTDLDMLVCIIHGATSLQIYTVKNKSLKFTCIIYCHVPLERQKINLVRQKIYE